MTEIIRNILTQTPIWVFILFAYLMFIGINARKQAVVPIAKLMVLPIIFTYMSLHTLIFQTHASFLHSLTWLLATAVSAIIGWLMVYKQNILVDKQHKLLQVPGSNFTLITILLIFSIKYYFSYAMSANNHALANPTFALEFITASGFCTGLFIGRCANLVYRFITGPFTKLG